MVEFLLMSVCLCEQGGSSVCVVCAVKGIAAETRESPSDTEPIDAAGRTAAVDVSCWVLPQSRMGDSIGV